STACSKSNENASAAQPGSAPSSAAAPAPQPQTAPSPDVAPVSTAQALEALRPPKGAKVAIVIFEDLQCPSCGYWHPQVKQIAKQYNVPIVIHDYPLPAPT